MTSIALDISGMTCAACSARVAKSLSRIDGVKQAEVNLALERANIELSGDVTAKRLIEAVERAGYGATLRSSDEVRRRISDEEREAALESVRRETVMLAIAAAEKLLRRSVDAEDNRRLVREYLDQVAEPAVVGV
jgi:P-type Cu+ transporter